MTVDSVESEPETQRTGDLRTHGHSPEFIVAFNEQRMRLSLLLLLLLLLILLLVTVVVTVRFVTLVRLNGFYCVYAVYYE